MQFYYSQRDRKSTRLISSHTVISYAVFCLKKKKASFFMIFYVVALQKMPTDLNEATVLEGLSRLNYFRRVTVPLVMPTTLLRLAKCVINRLDSTPIDHVSYQHSCHCRAGADRQVLPVRLVRLLVLTPYLPQSRPSLRHLPAPSHGHSQRTACIDLSHAHASASCRDHARE